MPIIAAATGGKDFSPAPSGPVQAVCCLVADMGEQWSEQYQKATRKVCVFFDLAAKMEDGRPFMLSKQYSLSLHEKAVLRHDLESWRGRPFTDQELAGFDVEKLIGANCLLNVVHENKGGKIRAKIAAIMPLQKGAPRITPISTELPKWVATQIENNKLEMAKHRQETTITDEDDKMPVVVIDEPPF